MFLRRLLGPRETPASAPGTAPEAAPQGGAAGETETVRRIVARLESLPAEEARFLAAFAYLLTRAAHADLEISDVESRAIERFVVEHGGLDPAQAVLVAEMAKLQARLHGATEDYLVTREFARLATPEQKRNAIRCAFAVGAADESITADELSIVNQMAREIGLDRAELNEVRAEFHEQLSAIQEIRRRVARG